MTKEYEKKLKLSTVGVPIFVAYSGALLPGGKIDKAPINPKNGRNASNSNPNTWDVLEKAKAMASELRSKGGRPGVGVVIGQRVHESVLIGIDLDGCINEAGDLAPWAAKIMALAPSYTEVSPSGCGAKILIPIKPEELKKLREATGAKHKKEYKQGPHFGIEIHLSNSYFTITWQEFGVDPEIIDLVGTDDTLRPVPFENLRRIIKLAEEFALEGRRKRSPGQTGQSGRAYEVVRAALFAIPNDGSVPENADRQWWLEIGMSLHHEFKGGAIGLKLYQEWSAQWPGYDPVATKEAWKSFKLEV